MITPAKDQYTFPHHNTKNSLNKALFFIILDGGKAVWRVTDRKESFPERYGGSMKRKLMMALLCASLTVSLLACGKQETAEETVQTESADFLQSEE